MPATIDLLETKKLETFAALQEERHDCLSSDFKVGWLEQEVKQVYGWVIQQSKGDMSVREVFDLWDEMVSVCDFFIDYVRSMSAHSPCPVSYDVLLDLRLAADEKREFYRCC